MSRGPLRRAVAAACSFLLISMCATVGAYAQQEQGRATPDGIVGGTIGTNNDVPSTGDGTTDVYAGVVVDYMFPLRYEVYGPDGVGLEGVSIEHFDEDTQEYVFVGRTDANGVWETLVPPSFWMNQINGIQTTSGVEAKISYGTQSLRHRISKDGYVMMEGIADVQVENINGEATGVVRITMEKTTAPQTPDTPGTLPETGVQSEWGYFAAGSLLLLLAVLILYKLMRDEKRHRREIEAGGSAE